MVDNKSKTFLIRHIQKTYISISIMKIHNVTLMLRTCIILLSSFMIYFFCMSFRKFSYFRDHVYYVSGITSIKYLTLLILSAMLIATIIGSKP